MCYPLQMYARNVINKNLVHALATFIALSYVKIINTSFSEFLILSRVFNLKGSHLPLKFRFALQIFMDTFHGCFEDTAHDYRYFATLYMAVRFLKLLIISIFSLLLYTSAISILFTFTLQMQEEQQS